MSAPDRWPIVNQSEPDFNKRTLQETLQLEGWLRKFSVLENDDAQKLKTMVDETGVEPVEPPTSSLRTM